ncbi:MAG TPA: T9SS type A sorting domain-containing protein [Bacteroidetes bacterium]|nr:T9SS type A sorting domain-containing protein [Bacteroidota bacterium]HEX03636.1 T9SS type A sorting domain-containing protein [Bacteroidota bacterium]
MMTSKRSNRCHRCMTAMYRWLFPVVVVLLWFAVSHAQTWDHTGPFQVQGAQQYFDPLDADRVFVTGRKSDNSEHTWLSTDRGVIWDEVSFADHPEGYYVRILFHPTQADTIWGYRSEELLLSTDRGWSWQSYSTEFPEISYGDKPVIDPLHPDNIYSFHALNLYTSEDRGLTWQWSYYFFDLGFHIYNDIVADPHVDGRLLVGGGYISDPFTFGIMAESLDHGNSWNLISEGEANTDFSFNPMMPDVVVGRYATEGWEAVDELRISVDNGLTFDPLEGPWENDGRAFFTDTGELIVVAREGVWTSSNLGETWTSVLADPETWPLLHTFSGGYEVSINPDDPSLMFLGYGTFRTGDSGTTWDNGSPDVPARLLDYVVAPSDPDIICARGYNATFISTDAGLNWLPLVRGGADSDIRFHPTDPEILLWKPSPAAFLEPGGPLLLSEDSGNTWTTIREAEYYSSMGDFDFDPENPEIIYVVKNLYSLWRSEDSGESWTRVLYSQYNPLSVFFNPDETNSVYASGGSIAWKSENNGLAWSSWNVDIDSPHHMAFQPGTSHMVYTSWDYTELLYSHDNGLTVDHAITPPDTIAGPPQFAPAGQLVIATIHGGVYESFDEGENWNEVGIEGNPPLRRGPVIASDGTVYVAAEDGGSWIGREVLPVAEGGSETLPQEFALEPVYPNPFNGTTMVSVLLPANAKLKVAVYNVTGQQVAELANGQFNAGNHSLTFDAFGMASGLYFVRATVPGHLDQVQKVMLVR